MGGHKWYLSLGIITCVALEYGPADFRRVNETNPSTSKAYLLHKLAQTSFLPCCSDESWLHCCRHPLRKAIEA